MTCLLFCLTLTNATWWPNALPSAKHPDFLPTNRLAGVLVLLYERDGAVRVLLTTRSKLLRSHPGQYTPAFQTPSPEYRHHVDVGSVGQVALPGGKSDPGDRTPFVTAVRFVFYLNNCRVLILDLYISCVKQTRRLDYR